MYMYFLKYLLLYYWVWFRQTECIVIMSMEGYTKFINFMTPSAGFPVQGCAHISHIAKMHFFFIYTQRHDPDKLSVYRSNDDQGRVCQNVKFHDPKGRGS